jgi:tetratricopeptide (TPR) repeat protein
LTPCLDFIEEGNAYRKAGDWARAEQAYRRATEVDSENSLAWQELGCLMCDARRFPGAAVCFRSALGEPAGREDSDAREVAVLLAKIVDAQPDWGCGEFSLGSVYEYLGEYERARRHLENALRLDNSRKAGVEALNARMFWMEGHPQGALEAADRALAVNPNSYVALLIKDQVCSAIGKEAEAVEALRRAVAILPDQNLHSSLLFRMNYIAGTTPESIYQEASRWNALYAAPLARTKAHLNSADPERRLKVGYVSPDMHQHTVMKFLPPVFEHRDRESFEVFVYAVGPNSDHVSDRVRSMVDHYARFQGSHDELAQQVRDERIDILVDLAGHSMGPALLAFALKPAPVQVSWMGYAGTTGMTAIDYYLGDAHMPCPGTEECFSEKIYRLPRPECCYRPIGDAPIASAPSLERGYITFGCFNNPRKITRQVAMLWSAILHLVKDSRLLLKFHRLEREDSQALLRGWFLEDGIAPERIEFEGQSPPGEYLAAYNRIDIALDPFPYNGGTTTLDALWMGVPVVTLAGRLAVQRAGASILAAAGWPDLITQTPEQYVKTALFLASAISEEPELRADIRKALMASPWMDEIGLVRSVEAAFRDMWRNWCREKK